MLRAGRGAEVDGRDWEREMWSLFFKILARDLRGADDVSLIFPHTLSGRERSARRQCLLEDMIHSM